MGLFIQGFPTVNSDMMVESGINYAINAEKDLGVRIAHRDWEGYIIQVSFRGSG